MSHNIMDIRQRLEELGNKWLMENNSERKKIIEIRVKLLTWALEEHESTEEINKIMSIFQTEIPT